MLARCVLPALTAALLVLSAGGAVPAPSAAPASGAPPAAPTGSEPGSLGAASTLRQGRAALVLPLPAPAVVLNPFRLPPGPYGSGHRGVDLAGAVGEVVRSAGAGTVLFAGMVAGRWVVSVGHGPGLRTTYEPVLPQVALGAVVSAGEAIGSLQAGHAGCGSSPCLHWGARLADGTYLDPMSLLRPLRIRLLPWTGPP